MTHNNPSVFLIRILSACHVFLLTISNIVVQFPFSILGFHTTFGAFIYPAIFVLTDLTIRLSNAQIARKVIFRSMFPGLLISYGVASYLEASSSQHWSDFFVFHPMPFRIALACFIAYVAGQLLDISVFQRYRNKGFWWLAPMLSAIVGNVMDTALFFAIAFYHCNNLFLSQHWMEIASVDIFFKIAISLIAFIPMYGIILNVISAKFTKKVMA